MMMLNDSIRYIDGRLHCDHVLVDEIAAEVGTPVYIYSLRRAVTNLRAIQTAFAALNPHIHYSAKANANLSVLRALISAGAGIDAVSLGEIHRAVTAGAAPEQIVFAGVGKTAQELYCALEMGIGWFNIENEAEARLLNQIAAEAGQTARVALRFNPDVLADTHPKIATGHGGAKFGLSAAVVRRLLERQADLPHLHIDGIHVHIGSQLHDTGATVRAAEAALELIAPYPAIRSVNLGGGLPVAYREDERVPTLSDFADALTPLLGGYDVLLEPGRSVIADAGLLVTRVLYEKAQGGGRFLIVDAGMTDLIRPALYDAHHDIIPLTQAAAEDHQLPAMVVGPVCETSDVLGRGVPLGVVKPGQPLAILTAGAYGMAMASNYNARPRPAEVVVNEEATTWRVARRRETWDDLLALELPL